MYMRKKGHDEENTENHRHSLLALIILAFGAFYTWSRFYIRTICRIKKQVNIEQVEHKNDVYTFASTKGDTGIILYPGAKVEPLSLRLYWE
ncbi:hypothetical protein ACEQPO_26145 [Bacillus sp. SL00103]